MNIEKLKPIPKYIEKRIRAFDKKNCPLQKGLRFYAYLTKMDKELIKITVAMRNKGKTEQLMKQVAVHGIYSKECHVRDMEYCYLGIYAYRVGWYDEGIKYRYGIRPKYNDGKWYSADRKYYEPYAPVVNLEYTLTIPKYRYSAITDYDGVKVFKYLRCYERYPQAEYLIKLGLPNLADKRTVLALLEKDKAFRRWIINNKNNLDLQWHNAATIIQAYKTGKSFDECKEFISRKSALYAAKDKSLRPIKKLFRGKRLERFFDYIDEQKISCRQYLDYLNACNHLGIDMSLNKNAYPHDFKRWHDIRIDEYSSKRATIDAKERKEFYGKFAKIANKYLPLEKYRNADFTVFIAQSPAELIREGDFLNHCVGRMNYDQKFVREETLIFFIRNLNEPEKPFVTVEYSLSRKTVLQCYGDNDFPPPANVKNFVYEQWLPFANKQLTDIKKSKAA